MREIIVPARDNLKELKCSILWEHSFIDVAYKAEFYDRETNKITVKTRCPKCKRTFEGSKCPHCQAEVKNALTVYSKSLIPMNAVILKSEKGITVKIWKKEILPRIDTEKWPLLKGEMTQSTTYLRNGRTIITSTYKSGNVNMRRFINSTYCTDENVMDYDFSYYLSEKEYDEYKAALHKAYKEQTGYVPSNDKYLAIANSLRNLPESFYASAPTIWKLTDDLQKSVRNLYRQLKHENYGYLTNLKLGKAINKIIINDPLKYVVCKKLLEAGITNKDEIRKILTKTNLNNYFINSYYYRNYMPYDKNEMFSKVKTFAEIFSKNYTKLIINLLNSELCLDTLTEIVETLNNKDALKLVEKDKLSYDVNKLHDYLSIIVERAKHTEHTYEYEEWQVELNEPEFALPVTNYDLISLGTKFRNCVGSYDRRILNKKATVVYMKKDDSPDVCMEIDDNKRLIQAKQFANTFMDLDQYKKVASWCDRHKINYEKCNDMIVAESGKSAGEYAYAF